MYLWSYTLYNSKPINDYWAGKTVCPVCGKPAHFHLQKNTKTFCLLVIPFMTVTDDRFITCDSCGYTQKLRIGEYNRVLSNQKALLAERNYPREMIETDFAPSNVKIASKLVKFILTGALHLFVFLGLALGAIESESILTKLMVGFFLSLFFAVPFLFSLKGIVPCWRKRSYYKKRAEFPLLAELAMGDEVNGISELVGAAEVEEYEHMMRGMDTEPYEHNAEVLEVSDGDDSEQNSELPKPLKAVPKKYPKGTGWFKYGSILCAVPKSFLAEKDLHAPCYRLAAGRFRMTLIWQSVLIILGLLFIGGGISRSMANEEGFEGMFFLGALCVGGSVGIMFANRVQTSRIIKSLRMLVKTGKFQYIDEIMPFIGNTNERFIFAKELMYDKGSRLVVAYDNILWVYHTVDDRNNIITAFCMSDGLRYTSTMNEKLLSLFLKKKPDVLVGKTTENENLYKQKLALLNICGE